MRPSETLADLVIWESQKAEERNPDLERDLAPALADQFHITDPQQWLDLCA
jgi:hypothetical protein